MNHRLRGIFRLGIRQKLVLVLAVSLLIALSVSTMFALRSQQEDFLRETDLRGKELARVTARSLANSVVSYNYHVIENWIQQAIADQEITYIRVLSPKGNVMAESGTPPESPAAGHVALFEHDVMVEGERVGKIVLGVSTDRIAQTLRKRQISLFTSELVVIAFIVVGEFLALSVMIVRPITRFLRSMSAAAAAHEADGRAQIDGEMQDTLDPPELPTGNRDEIGDLARTFLRLQKRTGRSLQALRASERNHRALIEAIPDLMLRLRGDGVCLDCKVPRDCTLAADPAQLNGSHIAVTLPSEFAKTLLYYLDQALRRRLPQEFEYVEEGAGQRRLFETRITASADDEALVIVRERVEDKRGRKPARVATV